MRSFANSNTTTFVNLLGYLPAPSIFGFIARYDININQIIWKKKGNDVPDVLSNDGIHHNISSYDNIDKIKVIPRVTKANRYIKIDK